MGRRTTQPYKLTRRDLLRVSAAGIVLSSPVAGCGIGAEGDGGRNNDGPSQPNGKEAPALAERVEAGELPPVEQRLPTSPVVVQPVEDIGVYGGEWRTAILGPADTYWLDRTVGYDPPLRWDPNFKEVLPNVAEEFEITPDAKKVTLKLRPGMKWSDGKPFTPDDVVFAQNEVYSNPELYPDQSNPGRAEKIDDLTVSVSFEQPDGLYLQRLAAVDVVSPPLTKMPAHYLKQFHQAHNPDVNDLAKAEGFENWIQLFLSKSGAWENPECPTLHAWVQQNHLGEGGEVTFGRNPYYFKTDPEGSQLPYLDKVTLELISDPQVLLTRTLQGDIDMHARHINEPVNKPVLAQNREKGDYHFFDLLNEGMNMMVIALNLTHPDPVKRQIFTNKDFRIGLSHAINREEIIEAVYERQGEPWQAAPRPESEFYDEDFAKQYTEYDVELANQILDTAGYAERDGNDRRLGPDGKPITISIEFASGHVPDWPDALDLVRRHWAAVGISVEVLPEDRSLFETRLAGNNHDAAVWRGDGGLEWETLVRPYWYLPLHDYSMFGTPWAQWNNSGGTSGEEPPAWVKEQFDLHSQVNATSVQAEQFDLMRQILDIDKEQFHVMGISLPAKGYGIVKNNFHNVPEEMPSATLYPYPGPTHPEQYYID